MMLIIQLIATGMKVESMNIIAATPVAIGTVKVHSGFGGTKPAPAGAAGLGSGEAIELSDGRTPGQTPPSEEYLPVYPKIIGEIFDKSV
jgi:hypothetical protein